MWNISTSMYTSCLQCTRVFTCLQTCHTHLVIFPTHPRWLKCACKRARMRALSHAFLEYFSTIRNIHQKTECERSRDNPKKMDNLYFLCLATLSGRDYEFREPTLGRESTVKRERVSSENPTAIGKSSDRKNQKMTQKVGKTFGLTRILHLLSSY